MNNWLIYTEGKNQYIYYFIDERTCIMIHSPGGTMKPQVSVSRPNMEYLNSKARVLHEAGKLNFYTGLFAILFEGIMDPDNMEYVATHGGFENIEEIFGKIK